MKKLFLILSFCFFLISCKKEKAGSEANIDISIFFSYRDSNNIDLLNPLNTSIYKGGDIDTYFLTNQGEKRKVYRANLDRPEMFQVINEPGYGYILDVGFGPDLDCFDQNNKATMYIRYKDGSEDILIGQFNADREQTQIQKLWVNGKLEWDGYPTTKPIVVLKK